MTDHCRIAAEILSLFENEHLRLTPIQLVRELRLKLPGSTKRDVHCAVKKLLCQGTLAYTQHYSTTHLELNSNRPLQVSDRIVLSPENTQYQANPNQIIIRLKDGTSFGVGDHPTTQLLIQGMDLILSSKTISSGDHFGEALDIGSGSGVLAIAAAKLGVAKVHGIDIDPVACHEALNNVLLNGLKADVVISQTPLEKFSNHSFDLIVANLRPPTIREILPQMTRISTSTSTWIISGCRGEEKNRLVRLLNKERFNLIWEKTDRHWSAFAVRRI